MVTQKLHFQIVKISPFGTHKKVEIWLWHFKIEFVQTFPNKFWIRIHLVKGFIYSSNFVTQLLVLLCNVSNELIPSKLTIKWIRKDTSSGLLLK